MCFSWPRLTASLLGQNSCTIAGAKAGSERETLGLSEFCLVAEVDFIDLHFIVLVVQRRVD